jgi:hypothetical protein
MALIQFFIKPSLIWCDGKNEWWHFIAHKPITVEVGIVSLTKDCPVLVCDS